MGEVLVAEGEVVDIDFDVEVEFVTVVVVVGLEQVVVDDEDDGDELLEVVMVVEPGVGVDVEG